MDFISFLFGIGFVQGIVLSSVLFVARSGHRVANALMATLVIAISLSLLQKLMVREGLWLDYPSFAFIIYPLWFTWGPLLFLYAYSLAGNSLGKRHVWHFAIPVALFLFVNLSFWQLDLTQQNQFVSYVYGIRNNEELEALVWSFMSFIWKPILNYQALILIFTLQFSLYCFLVLRQISEHNRRLELHFSSVDKINLRWLRALTNACLIFLGMYLVFNRVPFFLIENYDRLTTLANVHSMLLVVLLYSIAVSALFQPKIISGNVHFSDSEPRWKDGHGLHNPDVADQKLVLEGVKQELAQIGQVNSEKYERSKLSVEDAQRYKIRLMEVMQDKQLYLDNDLTLPDLARAANLTAPKISQVLNGQMNQNFFSFVNNYRIELAREILSNPETSKIAIVDLALEVGFKSKSSFYDAFKKATNMTPTQFKNTLCVERH